MRLNLGSGPDVAEGWTNVDRVAMSGVDVVHDLDVFPWPFVDCSAAAIQARMIFEHVDEPIGFMVECHRILIEHACLDIVVPWWRTMDAYTDPTHKRFCTEMTFDYWIVGKQLHSSYNAAYGGVSFELEALRLLDGALNVLLRKVSP